MQKEYVIAGIGLIVILLILLFPIAFIITDNYRDAAVDDLQSRVSHIKERYQRNKGDHRYKEVEVLGQNPTDVTDTTIVLENSIEAYKEFNEKKAVVDAKPIFELLLKKYQKKGTPEDKEKITAFCADNQELIIELRNLAATGGPFHDLDFSKGSKIEVPHLAEIRSWVWLLTEHAAMSAKSGDYEEATQDALAIAAFAEGLGKEPVLISQMVGVAIENRLYNVIAESIPGENLSPEQLAQIIEYTSRFNGRNDLADAMALEATWQITEAFDAVRNGQGERADSFVMRLYGSIGRPLLNQDEEIYVDIMERLSDTVRLPYYEAQPVLEQLHREMGNISFIRLMTRPTLHILAPTYLRMPETCARCEAELGLMQIGLTVEQYHAQHGEYPQTLEEIAPALDNTLPLDPYTGQGFVYKPQADGFILYSARGNIVPPDENRTVRGLNEQGNIVWRYTGD